MARKSGSTISQEELYPIPEERSRHEQLDDARLRDLDAEQESPFLRGQKRVSVRRGALPKKTATGLAWSALVIFIGFVCVSAVAALYHYGEHSWRFRIESSDDIQIEGLQNVARAQVMEVMAADIGRNIFFIPLAQRKAQLEQIPWVQSAGVMRFAPNHLKVQISERVPVAFAHIGSKIFLIDDVGTLMDLPANKKKYSFPVILGIETGETASTRKARMKIYNDLISQLDSAGAHYSQDLSEVDLSDLEDVKVLANSADGSVLVHLGSSQYLDRYKVYVAHVKEWRQQFRKVDSVDIRYDGQIVVNPDSEGAVRQATISNAAAKRAIAASVKPVSFISHANVRPNTDAAPSDSMPKTAVQKTISHGSRGHKKNAWRSAHASTAGRKAIKPKPKVQAAAKPSLPQNIAAKKKPSAAISKQQQQDE